MNPVLIMAGGTGGHIFPGLAVAQELTARGIGVAWLGTSHGMEGELVRATDIPFHSITIRGLRGNGWRGWLKAPFTVLGATLAAAGILRRLRPRAVLSMGGYVCGPGGVAAWLQRTPLVVHEQNSVAGLTNRILARLARAVLTGFDGVLVAQGGIRVGNPVRRSIADLPAPQARYAERSGPLRILVLGGSQGAAALNRTVPEALAEPVFAAPPVVRHQCGRRHLAACQEAYAAAEVAADVTPFIDDMAEAYAWADLVIARAGALTLAELAAAGCPAILVPYPHAVDDHQTTNAAEMEASGAAVRIAETNLTATALRARLKPLGDRATLLAMAQRARELGHGDAARRVADACLEVAG